MSIVAIIPRILLATGALSLSLSGGLCAQSVDASKATTSSPFEHQFTANERFLDIFSLMLSYQGAGFDDSVRRVAGSEQYAVTSMAGNDVTLSGPYSYDGIDKGDVTGHYDATSLREIKDGTPKTDLDGSGLFFNPVMWGTPPQQLDIGSHWSTSIPSSWELGPAGNETITVVALEPSLGRVSLTRVGSGAAASDASQPVSLTFAGRPVKATVESAGATHWRGEMTLEHGVVVADSLLVEHPVVIKTPDGRRFPAMQRAIMFLSLVPAPTSAT